MKLRAPPLRLCAWVLWGAAGIVLAASIIDDLLLFWRPMLPPLRFLGLSFATLGIGALARASSVAWLAVVCLLADDILWRLSGGSPR